MRGNHSQFGGPIVVPFSLTLPSVSRLRGLFTRLFCTGVTPGINIEITDICVQRCRANICRNECRSSWYSLRPVVWTDLHFSVTFGEIRFNFALKYSTLRIGAIAQLGERLHGMQEVGGSIPPGSTSFSFPVDRFSGLRPHRLEA